MDSDVLARSFEKMGARVQIVPTNPPTSPRLMAWGNRTPAHGFSVDVRKDRRGEFFEIRTRGGIDFKTLEVRPDDRHLLLMAENETGVKSKFLCGHDERQWFVAAVPNAPGVKDVDSAKEALKPRAVVASQSASTERVKGRRSRRNKVYKRQGEWFFTPMPFDFNPKPVLVLKNEPIRRGSGKPHMCECLYRTGGETVYVSRVAVNGLTESEYKDLLRREPNKANENWTTMRRDAGVYVKGHITHPDHATLVLDVWHNVFPNREGEAPHGKNVAFLD